MDKLMAASKSKLLRPAAFDLAKAAEACWHRHNGRTSLGQRIIGVRVRDGEAVTNPEAQAAAGRRT
jgi:hypothetical protein